MVDIQELAHKAGILANELRIKGFHCSESVLRASAEVLNIKLSDDFLKASTGFRGGGGGYRAQCGALCAGITLISMIYGRVNPEEEEKVDRTSELVKTLCQRFEDELGGTTCKVMRLVYKKKSEDNSCGEIYEKGAQLAVEVILSAHNISKTSPQFDLAKGGI